MSFEEFDQIFGQVSPDRSASHISPPKPFLFYVHIVQNDPTSIKITVTDFQSNTFHVIKSRLQLEDMRDDIGIGGSWSEFVDYITASLKSEDVKLVMEGLSDSGGASYAKLIAQKAKGMPRISISLNKLANGAACKAMGNLSLELYTKYKEAHNSLIEEQERSCQLTKIVAAEQEKNDTIQKQLDFILYSRKHKSQKINDRTDSDTIPVMVSQDCPDKLSAHSPSSTKVNNLVVPARRRSKVRGVVLEATEDDAQN